jgi:hypothetical protein
VVAWPHCFGPVVRQYIMTGVSDRAKPIILWLGHKKEEEKHPTQGPPSMTWRPPPRPHP